MIPIDTDESKEQMNLLYIKTLKEKKYYKYKETFKISDFINSYLNLSKHLLESFK